MSSAVASLVGTVLGGTLVIIGQLLARRSDERRHWQTLLSSAAAAAVTAYSQERAQIILDRSHGKEVSDAELVSYAGDRQRALGQLLTLPGGGDFREEIRAMSDGLNGMYDAYAAGEDEWLRSHQQAKQSIEHFASVVRARLRA